MTGRYRRYLSLAVVATSVLVPCIFEEATACSRSRSTVSPSTVEAATTIFRGKIVDYEIIERNFVKIRFEVTETYRGQKNDHWTLIWANSTFRVPASMAEYQKYYGTETVVGIAAPGTLGPPVVGVSSFTPPSSQDVFEHPWVMQSACAPPVMGKWKDGRLYDDLVKLGALPNDPP